LARRKRVTMKQSLLNEKEAPRVSLQEPQDLVDKAAQPEQLVEGKSSSDAADLQLKMKAAAKEFSNLLDEKLNLDWDQEDPFDLFIFKEISPFVHCSPKALFYRLGDAWVRIAEEYMRQPAGFMGTPAELLGDLRKFVTKYGKVSWVFPKLQKGGVA
jgi:hypothetical protein